MDALKKFSKMMSKWRKQSQSSQNPSHTATASTLPSVTDATTSGPSAGTHSDPQYPDSSTRSTSRSAPWIERVILFLRTAREGAELGSELAAPVKAVCGITITLLDAVQATNENREAWRDLIETIKEHNRSFNAALQVGEIDADGDSPLAKALQRYEATSLEVLQQVLEAAPQTIAAEDIRKASSMAKLAELAKRLGVSKWEAASIQQYKDRLQDSQRNIISTVVIYLAAKTERRDEDRLLETLRVHRLDELAQPAACMEGTRSDILQKILQWSLDTTQPNILWIQGHPGCGKSAIARSAAKEFIETDDVELASIFVFQRQQTVVLNPTTLWRTVAFGLAQKLPAVRKSLVTRIKANEIMLNDPDVDQLFQHLIVDSLTSITDVKPVVVVIDGLDECGGVEGRLSKDRATLMRALKKWPTLSSSIKLLVTSRAEDDIQRAFRTTGMNPLSVEIPVGSSAEPSSQASKDISLFLAAEFKMIAERYSRSLDLGWPGTAIIDELTRRASGLFIWAATVSDSEVRRRLGFRSRDRTE